MKVKRCYPVIHWPHHAQNVATSQQVSRDIQDLWDRVSQFLLDRSLSLAWMLQLPWRLWRPPCEYKLSNWWRTSQDPPHALHIVCYYGLDEVLNRLLSTGIGTGKLENTLELELFGGTPLLHAISGGFARAVQCLLNFGVETETRFRRGITPLGAAVRLGNEKISQLLIDRGAGVEARDNIGQTPLSHAAQAGRQVVAQLLLDRGAEIETRDNDGRTPLSNAAWCGKKNIMRLLLDRGAELEARDDSGWTPLSHAAQGGRKDAMQLLLGRGAEIETRDNDGRTPLSRAAVCGIIAVVELLLEYGAKIETRDNRSRTPLSHAAEFAASHGDSAMVCFLLTWPTINIHSLDDRGRTAIGWAEAISEKRTGRGKIASEAVVAILKAALLQNSHNLFTDGDGAALSSNGGHTIAC